VTVTSLNVTDGSVYGVFGGLLTGLVGAVGDNMSKLYGAFDDLALDPELQVIYIFLQMCMYAYIYIYI